MHDNVYFIPQLLIIIILLTTFLSYNYILCVYMFHAVYVDSISEQVGSTCTYLKSKLVGECLERDSCLTGYVCMCSLCFL